MEALLPIIIQLVAGGVGGNVLGRLAKNMDIGTMGNSITGAIGGLAGTWIAGMVPGLDGLIGAAAGAAGGAGGLDIGAMLGQGVTGVAGGGILTAIVGLVKNKMMKS